jgi:hypothetical protein
MHRETRWIGSAWIATFGLMAVGCGGKATTPVVAQGPAPTVATTAPRTPMTGDLGARALKTTAQLDPKLSQAKAAEMSSRIAETVHFSGDRKQLEAVILDRNRKVREIYAEYARDGEIPEASRKDAIAAFLRANGEMKTGVRALLSNEEQGAFDHANWIQLVAGKTTPARPIN